MGHTIASVFGNKPSQRPVGDTPLDAWLRAHEVSRLAFAKQLQVTPKTVTYWCNNQALPDLVNAFRISEATEGGVLPEMWLGTELARFLYNNARADMEAMKAAKRRDNRKQYVRRIRRNG